MEEKIGEYYTIYEGLGVFNPKRRVVVEGGKTTSIYEFRLIKGLSDIHDLIEIERPFEFTLKYLVDGTGTFKGVVDKRAIPIVLFEKIR